MAVDKSALEPGLFDEIGEGEKARLLNWMNTVETKQPSYEGEYVIPHYSAAAPYLGGLLMCEFNGTAGMLNVYNDGTEQSNALLDRIFCAWNPDATAEELDEWRGGLEPDSGIGVDLRLIGEPTPSKEEVQELLFYGNGANGGNVARYIYAIMMYELGEIDGEGHYTAKHWENIGKAAPKAQHLTPEVKSRKLATSLAVKLLPATPRNTAIEEARRAEDPDNDKITRIYADLPEGVTMGRPVTETDVTVMNAIASYMDAGVNCVSAPQFCRFVNGTNGRPRKEAVERTTDAIRRLFVTPVKIVATEELRGSGEPIDEKHTTTVETTAVKGEIITDEASNGREVVKYRFDEMPAIWQLAYSRGQHTSIPQRSFRRIMDGLQATERNVNLADYLTRRVAEIRKNRAYMSNQMRYETIYAEVTPAGGKQWGEVSRRVQSDFRASVTHIMDGLQAEGRLYRWFEYQNTGEGRGNSRHLTTTKKSEKVFTDGKKSETRPWYQTERLAKCARMKAEGVEVWPHAPKKKKKLEKAES